jgi:hypothetical protein
MSDACSMHENDTKSTRSRGNEWKQLRGLGIYWGNIFLDEF